MKACVMCGRDASDETASCSCGYNFRTLGASGGSVEAKELAYEPRPNGRGILIWAYTLLAGSVLVATAGFTVDISPYGEIDTDRLLVQWWLFAMAGGGFSIGWICWAVGKVVHALSFVQGADRETT